MRIWNAYFVLKLASFSPIVGLRIEVCIFRGDTEYFILYFDVRVCKNISWVDAGRSFWDKKKKEQTESWGWGGGGEIEGGELLCRAEYSQ